MTGTHQKYKEDTAYCAQWLVDTASELGHDMSQHRKRSASSSNADSTAATSCYNDSKFTIYIQTNDFLPLALTIADLWPRATVSDVFMRRLRAALQARTVCASWYADAADPEIQEDNQKHRHFIGVLQSVLDCLRPFHVQQQRQVRSPRYKQPSIQDVSSDEVQEDIFDEAANAFGKLELSEPGQDLDILVNDTQPTGDTANASEIVSGNHVTFDEAAERKEEYQLFAIQCLLLDLHRLRLLVAKRWTDYAEGKCDLVVASVTMNLAVDVCMRLEDDLVQSLGLTNRYDVVLLSFVRSRMRYSNTDTLRAAIGEFDKLEERHMDLNDFTFMKEYLAGAQFLREKRESNIATSVGGHAHNNPDHPFTCPLHRSEEKQQSSSILWFHATDSISLLDLKDEGLEGIVLPRSHVARIRAAFGASFDFVPNRLQSNTNNAIEDCVLSCLYNAYLKGCVDLSTSFALRMFYDSHDFLGEDTSKPLMDLDAKATSLRMQARIQIAWLKKMGHNDDEVFRGDYVASLPSSAHRLIERAATNILEDVCEQGKSAWFLTPKRFRDRLANNPVACGLHRQWLEIQLCNASLLQADHHEILIGFAHFYNAARASGKLAQPWRDMEYFIDIHTPEHLFMGGRPETIENALTKFRIALRGTGLHGKGSKQWYHRRKLTAHFATLSRILIGRTVTNFGPEQDHDMQDLELAIPELNLKGKHHRIKLNDQARITNRAELRGWHRAFSDFGPLEFLTAIEAQFKSELKEMRFDHTVLERRCIVALERMRDVMDQAGHDLRLTPEDRTRVGAAFLESEIIKYTMLVYEQVVKAGFEVSDRRLEYMPNNELWRRKGRFEEAVKGLDIYLKENEKNEVKDLCEGLVRGGPRR